MGGGSEVRLSKVRFHCPRFLVISLNSSGHIYGQIITRAHDQPLPHSIRLTIHHQPTFRICSLSDGHHNARVTKNTTSDVVSEAETASLRNIPTKHRHGRPQVKHISSGVTRITFRPSTACSSNGSTEQVVRSLVTSCLLYVRNATQRKGRRLDLHDSQLRTDRQTSARNYFCNSSFTYSAHVPTAKFSIL